MFAWQQMSAWASHCLDYLNPDCRDWSSYDEIHKAELNASGVYDSLHWAERLLREQHPHRTDVIQLIDNVLQALKDDHGGKTPQMLLFIWASKSDKSFFAAPEEKKAMTLIWERWKDTDRVKEEFWIFKYYRERRTRANDGRITLREKRVLQLQQSLQDWLQRRRSSPVY